MARGGSSAQRVCGGDGALALGGASRVRRVREREGRLREGAGNVTAINSCGGDSGGELLLLRWARERACVVSAREVMRTGHTTDRATRTDSGGPGARRCG